MLTWKPRMRAQNLSPICVGDRARVPHPSNSPWKAGPHDGAMVIAFDLLGELVGVRHLASDLGNVYWLSVWYWRRCVEHDEIIEDTTTIVARARRHARRQARRAGIYRADAATLCGWAAALTAQIWDSRSEEVDRRQRLVRRRDSIRARLRQIETR